MMKWELDTYTVVWEICRHHELNSQPFLNMPAIIPGIIRFGESTSLLTETITGTLISRRI